jgi:hypothetical protein
VGVGSVITQWVLEAFFEAVKAVVAGLAAMLPAAPTFITDATSAISSWWTIVPDAVKYFVPIGPLIVAGGVYLALSVSLGVLALIRRVVLAVIP